MVRKNYGAEELVISRADQLICRPYRAAGFSLSLFPGLLRAAVRLHGGSVFQRGLPREERARFGNFRQIGKFRHETNRCGP
jgi:hypothetical protein